MKEMGRLESKYKEQLTRAKAEISRLRQQVKAAEDAVGAGKER